MLPELQTRFEAVESQRIALQNEVCALNDAQQIWTPGGETWSIRQIVEHLVLSDETIGQAQDAGSLESEALMFRVLPRTLRRALVLRAFNRDMALPMPSPAVAPRGNVLLPDLLARWEMVRDKMRRALDTMQTREKPYAHPVLGPLNAPQMLDLEQSHTNYHARQIAALRRAPSFPPAAQAQ